MRFIRKNGRIIPIRDSNGGGGPAPAPAAKIPKPQTTNSVGSRFKVGYAVGSFAGGLMGLMHGSPLKGSAVGGAIGGTTRAVLGPRKAPDHRSLPLAANLYVGMGIAGTALIGSRFVKVNPFTAARSAAIVSRAGKAIKSVFTRSKVIGQEGNVIFGKFPKR